MQIKIRTDDVVSINQAAEQIGVDRVTIYRWIAKGDIISVRFGDVQYIPKSEIVRLVNERKARQAETPKEDE